MHIEQTDAGTWRVQVRHGGRRASGTYPSKREAQRRGAQLLIELGGSPTAITATVGDICADHCADLAEHRSATYADDMERVTDRLPDTIRHTVTAKVTPVVVEAWYRQLAADGWSPHRIHRAHELFAGAFKRAHRLGMVAVNPMPSVRPPKLPDADIHPPSPHAVAGIVGATERTVERLVLHLAATTGARRGELVALQWADLEGASLAIRRSLAYTPTAGVHERPTKTGRKGQRVLTLDAMTVRMLETWRWRRCRLGGAVAWIPFGTSFIT